jgi:hypothetical protein
MTRTGADGTAPPPAQRPRTRGWVWYFVTLAVLTLTSLTVLIRYNLARQLKPEQLAQARALWEAKGPADYDMDYAQQGSAPGAFKVRVRHKKVVSVTRDGRPLEERLRRFSGMNALFGFIEDYLVQDSQPGAPRTFVTASFDPEDGHLLHYVRRVMGSTQRVEITVRLHPANPAAANDRPDQPREP